MKTNKILNIILVGALSLAACSCGEFLNRPNIDN